MAAWMPLLQCFRWSFFAEKTPRLKIRMDGGMDAAITIALGGVFSQKKLRGLKSAWMAAWMPLLLLL